MNTGTSTGLAAAEKLLKAWTEGWGQIMELYKNMVEQTKRYRSMKPKILLRIASILMLLHTAGHTMGALTWKEAPNAAVGTSC